MPCSDLETCVPEDWVPDPAGFLPAISEPDVRAWALQVHALWTHLCLHVRFGLLMQTA